MNEVRFERGLVRALLRDQHPDLADLELRDVEGGWDNQQWRLGERLAVRLPRTERAPALLETERLWLPSLAERLPLPTPVPVRVGVPSHLFEHTWTIAMWVDGEPADREPITDTDSGLALAEFLRALHRPAPVDAPANPQRGMPLLGWPYAPDDHAFELIGGYAAAARVVWQHAVAAPVWDGPPLWLHADLHPANVVVQCGRLAGVIDFGELCAGDPATDLSAAWLLLPAGAIPPFFESYGPVDEATMVRARGWAVLRALGLIAIGCNGKRGIAGGKPTWEPAGHAALERVLAADPR